MNESNLKFKVQNSKVKVALSNNGFKTRSKICDYPAPIKCDFIGQLPDY
jgi:hypothetical protein